MYATPQEPKLTGELASSKFGKQLHMQSISWMAWLVRLRLMLQFMNEVLCVETIFNTRIWPLS